MHSVLRLPKYRQVTRMVKLVTIVDLYTFVMLPVIAKYHTLAHRRQTELLIDQQSFVAIKVMKPLG